MTPRSGTDQFDLADAIREERLGLCDFLQDIDDAGRRSDSLCSKWTVHDVAAHLTLTTREGWWDVVRGAIAARGDFDRMTADGARRHAQQFSPTELVDQLRHSAGQTRRAPMSSPLDPLADLFVHGQDIARPLRRPLPMHPDHVVPALEHVVNSRWYGAAKRFAGLRLAATDADWSHGDGPGDVRGSSGDLLMVATDRSTHWACSSGTAFPSCQPA